MDLQKRRVLILGFGISGRGAAELADFLGMIPIPVDVKIPEDSAKWKESVFHWTEDSILPPSDLAVISPGIPSDSAMARAVRSSGIPLIGELEFASLANPCRIVAITGTNGKTTTTELTTSLLCTNGIRAESAGNIGTSLSFAVLEVLKRKQTDLLVVESSSFQLETVDTFAPSSAAWLNLASDHINRHGSMEEYARAKSNLFRRMRNRNAVLNANLPEKYADPIRSICSTETFSASMPADFSFADPWIFYHAAPVVNMDEIQLKGLHNVENIMAALALLRAEAGTDALFSAASKETLRSFRPDVHRMEFFTEIGGVRFVDDSKATNPHSVNAALKAFGGKKNVILILGGSDKNMDFSSIAEDADKVKCAFLIGQSALKIERTLGNVFSCTHCKSMEDAVERGYASAKSGDIVAMCPACASFDMFRDYKDRGEKFKAAVFALKNR